MLNKFDSRFLLYYYSGGDAKKEGETEIQIDTRGSQGKKVFVHDEFNIDEQDTDDLKLAIQTK